MINIKEKGLNMKRSPYYRQVKIPLNPVTIERVALAKAWADKNKRSVTQWPGYHFIKNILR